MTRISRPPLSSRSFVRYTGTMKTIDDIAHGRDNNFNLLRMIAASAVLISHSWPLALGAHTEEPLQSATGYKLGTSAVMIFFAISGFFITKSVDRTHSTIDFLSARVLRLYPALIVALLLTLFVLGPTFTALDLGSYFRAWHSWTYLPRNVLLYRPQWELPGVFANNIYGPAINGSLWTLFFEVSCYVLLLAVGLGKMLRPRRFTAVIAVMAALQIYLRQYDPAAAGSPFALLSLPFFIGAACYVYRSSIPLSFWLAGGLAIAAAALVTTPAFHILYAFALSYGALWLGSIAWPPLKSYNLLGDYSYGMYIYAYPVQQMLSAIHGPMSPWVLAITAFPVSLFLAIISWNLIERRALEHRHRPGRWYDDWRLRRQL